MKRAAFRHTAVLVASIWFSLFARADDWPQWLGPQRDAVWRETGIVEKFPPQGPPVRWRAPVGGGYAGPAVAGGRVYVTDRIRDEGASDPLSQFARGSTPSKERVLCLNEADGKVEWKFEYPCVYTISYPAGPRVTPVVAEGKVWTLGAEGHLVCLDAATGRLIWSRELKKDYGIPSPLWGFSAHPLLDGPRLICLVGGEGSVAVAFDKNTGRELWRALSAKEPGYCPPVIYEAGGRRQLIIWHPQAINSLDPETGGVFWSEPFFARAGLSLAMPRKLGDRLFISAFYNGPILLRLDAARPAVTVVWRGQSNNEKNTDKLHCLMSTPFLEDGHIYGVCSYGQFRCLRLDTGERVWETLKVTGAEGEKFARWCNAFIVKNGNRFFLPNEKGDLIIAKLSPRGYEEVSRAHLLEPTGRANARPVLWCHPAFANRCVYWRNDKEIICVSLASP
ncbi:MAG: PQQ-like beta-propeller repeat protein [Verrucomicrobiae bacterium]|nr:PQQ-like beta-propeller repeat protein [Verrucomicrobiae bacterium]